MILRQLASAIFKVVSSPYEDIVQVCQEGLAQILKNEITAEIFLILNMPNVSANSYGLLPSGDIGSPFETRSTSFTITGFWGD